MKDQRKTKARLIKELATLRQSEERYRQLFESANDAIVSLTLDGIITTVNRGVEVLLSWSREEQIGRHYREFLTPSSVVFTEERAQRIQAGEKVSSIFEIELLRKDGSVVPVEARSRFIRDRQGKPIGVLASYRDITARKQAEAEKQELQEQLFQARKMEALGTLAGGVAHDFNNILSAIMGFTELATDEVPESTVVRRNLEEVLKASRRAKGLVQQILTFSRPSQPKSEPIQLHLTIEEVLMFLRASLPPTIEIRHQLDKTAGPVAISTSQLQQVLTNLCVNAIGALGEKGGVLEVRLQRVEVENDFARRQKDLKPGPHLRLTVSDTGCGMTSAVQERIFEPFFTTRPVGEGNGLGLAIVHGIVTGHGGAITVESMPGKGTKFCIYLPTINGKHVSSKNVLYHSPSPVGIGFDEKGAPRDTTHFDH
ncbi:MAG TPA: PAS domain S-box protein [Candidatus Binatia bacterium]|nr:PAS domain S-box protein [Candidatus Binatia bacterium]